MATVTKTFVLAPPGDINQRVGNGETITWTNTEVGGVPALTATFDDTDVSATELNFVMSIEGWKET